MLPSNQNNSLYSMGNNQSIHKQHNTPEPSAQKRFPFERKVLKKIFKTNH